MLSFEADRLQNAQITRRGRHLEATTPTAKISCDLPLACSTLGHGAHIDFLKLPISCDLSPHDILRHACIGKKTMVSEGTRTCITQCDDIRWKVQLGRTTLNLYTAEAQDMCACLDAVGEAYTHALNEGNHALEVWEYPQAVARGHVGVRLTSVHTRIWQLMQRYARTFQSSSGDTIWHCFGNLHHGDALTITQDGDIPRATIWAMTQETYGMEEYIPLLYEYPDAGLLDYEERTEHPWQEHIGPHGIWTARYAEQWLLDIFLPQLLSYYQVQRQASILSPSKRELRLALAEIFAPDVFMLYRHQFSLAPRTLPIREELRTPIEHIQHPAQLLPYVKDLQKWLECYPVARIPSALFRPYYTAIAAFAEHVKPTLCVIWALAKLFDEDDSRDRPVSSLTGGDLLQSSFESFSINLHSHVRRVNELSYEYTACAQLLTQTLIQILEHDLSLWPDALMKTMRTALQPLWEQARFDCRHCIPHEE